jgi:hypothetical protein
MAAFAYWSPHYSSIPGAPAAKAKAAGKGGKHPNMSQPYDGVRMVFKSRLCRNFSAGYCYYDHCQFAHGEQDLHRDGLPISTDVNIYHGYPYGPGIQQGDRASTDEESFAPPPMNYPGYYPGDQHLYPYTFSPGKGKDKDGSGKGKGKDPDMGKDTYGPAHFPYQQHPPSPPQRPRDPIRDRGSYDGRYAMTTLAPNDLDVSHPDFLSTTTLDAILIQHNRDPQWIKFASTYQASRDSKYICEAAEALLPSTLFEKVSISGDNVATPTKRGNIIYGYALCLRRMDAKGIGKGEKGIEGTANAAVDLRGGQDPAPSQSSFLEA